MASDDPADETDPVDLDALVGHRFPDGAYTITAEENEELRWIVDAPGLPPGVAHPTFCHLATHVGKGITFAEFAELVGSSHDAGFLFGGGSWDLAEPLRVGVRYRVEGGITAAEARVGKRTGRFDLITTELDLVDPDTGRRVATSIEHYVCPRGVPA
jgi:hypothetical protein